MRQAEQNAEAAEQLRAAQGRLDELNMELSSSKGVQKDFQEVSELCYNEIEVCARLPWGRGGTGFIIRWERVRRPYAACGVTLPSLPYPVLMCAQELHAMWRCLEGRQNSLHSQTGALMQVDPTVIAL